MSRDVPSRMMNREITQIERSRRKVYAEKEVARCSSLKDCALSRLRRNSSFPMRLREEAVPCKRRKPVNFPREINEIFEVTCFDRPS